MGLNTMTGLVPLVKKILIGTGIIEGIGAVLYATQYVPEFGIGYGVWAAIFNSISAFCNAGMDIVRDDSLRSYVTNPVMNFTTMGLIILGIDRSWRTWIYCMERSLAGIQKDRKR